MEVNRRLALTGLTAAMVSACTGRAATNPAPAALKSLTDFPLGVCAMTAQMNDPDWAALVGLHFDRITPEWEMKMEYILQADGSLRFDAPDRLMAFAAQNRQSVYGHALVWYSQDGEFFQRLKGNKNAFEAAYRGYTRDVVSRYKGKITGWDVVNEPIIDKGTGLRDCLWRDVFGDQYIDIAFEAARDADPDCPRVLNDYNLEYTPAKRRTFLKLVDDLQKRDVPLDVLGTQTHIAADLPDGALTTAIRDLAATGLKIHVSEVDISLKEASQNHLDFKAYRERQYRLMSELTEAFVALPTAQQFGMTIWGLRDRDSWYNRGQKGLLADEPLWFDDTGGLKPTGQAFITAL